LREHQDQQTRGDPGKRGRKAGMRFRLRGGSRYLRWLTVRVLDLDVGLGFRRLDRADTPPFRGRILWPCGPLAGWRSSGRRLRAPRPGLVPGPALVFVEPFRQRLAARDVPRVLGKNL